MSGDNLFTIRRADLLAVEAQALIRALNANHFRLDPEEVGPGRGAFLIASRDSQDVGCGAIRRLENRTGEIKRMYVCPAERGRGVGGAILSALEQEARTLGVVRLVLETGPRQPEAIALYERAGFTRIGAFGEYRESPLSVFMRKELF
jgi:putative acetyltransferase